MIKHLLFFITFSTILFFPGFGFAQGFKTGLTAGINNARVLGGENHSGWRQFGIIGGPFVEYDLNELSGLKMEMLFSQKGERKPYRPEQGDIFYKLRLNYIEVPILYLRSHNKFIFEAGPSFSYLINYSEKDLYGPITFERPFKKLEFSAHAGINYQISDNFDMNWRYSNSLIPVREHVGGAVWWFNRGQYNSVLTFKIIYWINRKQTI